ncbi:MAG TPA: PhzF family phenazine biosynthesis isomerase, partial [Ktedonobacterales bacterium]|nr:PhzF family phenazine biosynthesis isomerase [Ktedonobacterales bacterium]
MHLSTVRIFTREEELDFAGHPVLDAACVLHALREPDASSAEWRIMLNARDVSVTSERGVDGYTATMDQGRPRFQPPLADEAARPYLVARNSRPDILAAGFPLQVVSTGLPYLLVLLRAGLAETRIVHPRFGELLAEIGAQFVYVLDAGAGVEGRTWDNDGRVEDVATGSAAGPVGAYLVRHGRAQAGTESVIQQGRFVGRPSEIVVRVEGAVDEIQRCAGTRRGADGGVVPLRLNASLLRERWPPVTERERAGKQGQ